MRGCCSLFVVDTFIFIIVFELNGGWWLWWLLFWRSFIIFNMNWFISVFFLFFFVGSIFSVATNFVAVDWLFSHRLSKSFLREMNQLKTFILINWRSTLLFFFYWDEISVHSFQTITIRNGSVCMTKITSFLV